MLAFKGEFRGRPKRGHELPATPPTPTGLSIGHDEFSSGHADVACRDRVFEADLRVLIGPPAAVRTSEPRTILRENGLWTNANRQVILW